MNTVTTPVLARCLKCGKRQGEQVGNPREDGGAWWECGNCRWGWLAIGEPLPGSLSMSQLTSPLPIENIIEEACVILKVAPEEFYSKSRHRAVVTAREIVAVLGRRRTKLSYTELAEVMRRPAHATIVEANQRAHERMAVTIRELVGPDPSMPGHVAAMTLEQVCALVERRVSAKLEVAK